MIVSICRLFGLNSASSVEAITSKLRFRVEKMRSLSLIPIGDLSDDEQTELLQQVKRSHKSEVRSPFEPDDINMIIDALQYYDQIGTNVEEHQRLCGLVTRIQELKQNHDQTSREGT